MCLMADYDKVFEVAPVFRVENWNTHRHQREFVCMDIEIIIKEHFTELLDLMGDLCLYMLKGIEKKILKRNRNYFLIVSIQTYQNIRTFT